MAPMFSWRNRLNYYLDPGSGYPLSNYVCMHVIVWSILHEVFSLLLKDESNLVGHFVISQRKEEHEQLFWQNDM